MGKGKDNAGCDGLSALLAGVDPDKGLLVDSKRVAFTCQLAQELTGMPVAQLLTDPGSGQTIQDGKQQNKVIVHNVLLAVAPEAFRDRDLYHRALDIYYTLLLDGDIKASHLYHYHDGRTGGWWTPGAARAAMNWYGLPNSQEGLTANGLKTAVRNAIHKPSFLDSLKADPSGALALCAPVWNNYQPDQDLGEQSAVQELWADTGVQDVPFTHENLVRLHYAQAAGCSPEELEALVSLPSWGEQPVATEMMSSQVKEIIQGISVSPSEDGYPQVKASGASGKVADLWQSWMASPWVDLVSQQIQRQSGPDGSTDPEWTRQLCWRSSWKSSWGRKNLQPAARAQESRLRKIMQDLLQPGAKPSKAPARPAAL